MNAHALGYLDKAADTLRAAQVLLEAGFPEQSAGRAYYAMFHAATALLLEAGEQFSKHSAVHSAFGLRFASTRILDPKYHRWLLDAFDRRLEIDYGLDSPVAVEEGAILIAQAGEFLDIARRYLEMAGG